MNCKLCGAYYRQTEYNPTDYCMSCIDQLELEYEVSERDEIINSVLNPSGKVQPVFYDEA